RQGADIFLPGIVVEEAGTGYSQTPALQKGDVLLSWSRSDAHGEFQSPTLLWIVDIEQRALGPVVVHGLRDGQPRDWTLTASDYRARVRPNVTGEWLRQYELGRDLARAGRVSQAARCWLTLARSVPVDHAWLSAWLNYAAGRVLTDHHRWKEADAA